MKISKLLLLSAIATIGSFSIIKPEFTLAEKVLLKKLAKKSLRNAIDSCDISENMESLCDNDNDHAKNTNLFLHSIDQMTLTAIAPIVNKYIEKATEKAKSTPCDNCEYLAKDITDIALKVKNAIDAGNGSQTYFEASVPQDEQDIFAQTISQAIAEAKDGDLVRVELVNLQKEGKGHLTILQVHQQGQEDLLRKALNSMQTNK